MINRINELTYDFIVNNPYIALLLTAILMVSYFATPVGKGIYRLIQLFLIKPPKLILISILNKVRLKTRRQNG